MNNLNADEVTIARALGSIQGVREVKKLGPMRWAFAHHNGTAIRCEARRDGPWLVLGAGLPRLARGQGLDAGQAWRLLVREGDLPGGCRFALAAGDPPAGGASLRLAGKRDACPTLSLRAEVLLAEEVDLGLRLGQALASFGPAFNLSRAQPTPEPAAGRGESVRESERGSEKKEKGTGSAVAPTASSLDLAGLSRETGWTVHEGEGESLRIDLDVPREDGFYQADLREEAERGVVASVQLAAHDSPAPEVLGALGVMLLTANAATRLARATASEGERVRLGFEVVLPTPPGAGELADVLACLSVACRHCGREADAMDPGIAKEYLSIRGWSL